MNVDISVTVMLSSSKSGTTTYASILKRSLQLLSSGKLPDTFSAISRKMP
jgi:hypothetical protein